MHAPKHLSFSSRSRRSRVLLGVVAVALAGCTSNEDPDPSAVDSSRFDPSSEAWDELRAHPDYDEGEIVFLEIAALGDHDDASAQYDDYLDVLVPEIERVGGELILVHDIVTEGTGDLFERDGERYRGGVAYSARYPSRAAMEEVWDHPAVVDAHSLRVAALSDVQMMLGADQLPPEIAAVPKDVDAATIPTPYVDGKTSEQMLDELLSIYPDGGADPTSEQLGSMLELEGFADRPLHYLNLYDWGRYGEEGMAAHDEYNARAQMDVAAHGIRVYARVEIEQVLVGPHGWDRLIIPRWPSMGVFTDLRLTPSYVDAQESRVTSAEIYGNYVTHAR